MVVRAHVDLTNGSKPWRLGKLLRRTWSYAPTPSMDRTVHSGSKSVIALMVWPTQSVPVRVERANWNGHTTFIAFQISGQVSWPPTCEKQFPLEDLSHTLLGTSSLQLGEGVQIFGCQTCSCELHTGPGCCLASPFLFICQPMSDLEPVQLRYSPKSCPFDNLISSSAASSRGPNRMPSKFVPRLCPHQLMWSP